jgi:hypothetical protein
MGRQLWPLHHFIPNVCTVSLTVNDKIGRWAFRHHNITIPLEDEYFIEISDENLWLVNEFTSWKTEKRVIWTRNRTMVEQDLAKSKWVFYDSPVETVYNVLGAWYSEIMIPVIKNAHRISIIISF